MDDDVHIVVDASPGGAGQARRFIAGTLAAWNLGGLARRAIMVGHELVANALRHAGPPAGLRLLRRRDSVLLEVTDPELRVPKLPKIDNTTSESGRGLRIVSMLARRWGVQLHDDGKTVWAEISE